jgi:hypothetical protein
MTTRRESRRPPVRGWNSGKVKRLPQTLQSFFVVCSPPPGEYSVLLVKLTHPLQCSTAVRYPWNFTSQPPQTLMASCFKSLKLCAHTNCAHTNCVHIQTVCTYKLCTYKLCAHTNCAHTLTQVSFTAAFHSLKFYLYDFCSRPVMLKLSADRRLQLKQLVVYLGNGSDAGYCGSMRLPSVNTK